MRNIRLTKRLAVVLLLTLLPLTAVSRADGPRVVLISVDGLRPDAITADVAPNLVVLRDAGTYAAEAWNDLPAATLPNHTTMLTGLVVDQHGVLLNVELPGQIAFPTVFDYATTAGLRCAFFASKSKLAYLAPPDALETIVIEPEMDVLVAQVLDQLDPDGPDLIFLHLGDPDSIGHQSGWMSAAYLDAVTHADALIGEIVAALDADTSRASYVLITADHGGEGTVHVLNTPAVRRIPWIVTGPDIVPGNTLDGIVTTADTTPTILWLLGVDVPTGLWGVVRTGIKDPAAQNSDAWPAVPPLGLPCMVLILPACLVAGLAVGRAGKRRSR